VKCASSQE